MPNTLLKLNIFDTEHSSGGKCFKMLNASGLFDRNGSLVASWDTLTDTYGMDVAKDYSGKHKTDPSSPYYVLTNNDALSNGVKLVMGNGVSQIGDSALRDCTNLTRVVIPNGVSIISYSAFSDCTNLVGVVIPDSVVNLVGMAFYNCASLTSVKIPKKVTKINISTFRNCSSLKSVTIAGKVTSIADHAFGNCNSLTDVYYTGTKEEWEAITIGSDNSALTNATIHYNYNI